MGRLYWVVIIIFLLIPRWGLPQAKDCEQTIALATDEFNAGHFYSVPGILNECLNSFTRDQRQRAFLLLTQTYLLLDDPIGAQRSYLEILGANPEFVADEQLHPIDVVYLSKKFTATPRLSWFVGGGSNVSPVRVIHDVEVSEDGREKYTLRPGYNLGAGGEYSYDDNIRFRAEVNFFQTSYRAQAIGMREDDIKTFIDRQTWVNVPFYVCYSDNIGQYRPYGYAGYSFSSLMSDRASITLRKSELFNDAEIPDFFEVKSPDFDFKARRNKLNQSIIFGVGIKYKIGLDFAFVDLRYSAGLRNIVNPDYIYGDNDNLADQKFSEWVASLSPTMEFAHVDDYIRLDNLSITLGFVRPLYKPRELKRARTKSVLRKMKRSK